VDGVRHWIGLVWLGAVAAAGCGPAGDPCRGVDCSGHGRCVEQDGRAACVCQDGFVAAGLDCLADACFGHPCVHGACRVEQGRPVCDCRPGYAGPLCDGCASGYHAEGLQCAPDSPCDSLDCVHGQCLQVAGAAECDCRSGYAGERCDRCAAGYHPVGLQCVGDSACDPDPCVHGACRAVEGEARCDCRAGYAGPRCAECAAGWVADGLHCVPAAGSPCAPNPCTEAHRTVCQPDGTGHVCLCDAGYQDNDGDGACLPDCATAGLDCGPGQVCSDDSGSAQCVAGQQPPIYIAFHWHMHQPIYWPYESIVQTEAEGRMGYSVYAIHQERAGPYGSWPRDAVAAGSHLAHLGAQVSFSGSLMENLDAMAAAGAWAADWTDVWAEAMAWDTAAGNPRLDVVHFGYHHPLMGLIDASDIRLQIQAHRLALERHFGSPRSRGIFPPECAFSTRMIPALVAEGIEWVLVDNIHFDRAHVDYPWVPESNLPPPNPADQVNDAPTEWLQLNGLWAPSRVAAPWGYRPHWVEYVDPASGQTSRMVAVPAARYEGNEDGRGGFGALQYEQVMSQYEHLNTDPDHPMLVVLHHDGDNYGGGTDSYYHSNFQSFVAWLESHPERFAATTIQDYLDRFPPDPDDVIHVEDGAWAGADNGDPEFHKWNGDPDQDGYSPDRNSWAVITAVKNRVLTAESVVPHSSIAAVVDGDGNATDRAWHYLLNAETSCYWYWDHAQDGIWDSHPTRAANRAAAAADAVLDGAADTVAPTIYLPQREPYNPGLGAAPSDLVVWTYVYDVSGLDQVRLHYRVDADGVRDAANAVYAGGDWQQIPMTAGDQPSQTDPQPTVRAQQYSAGLSGLSGVLVDYYVSASDGQGNLARSPLLHVYIGSGTRRRLP
jgi:hypothetical protein